MSSVSPNDSYDELNAPEEKRFQLVVAAVVHPADIQDRDATPLVATKIRSLFPWLLLALCTVDCDRRTGQ